MPRIAIVVSRFNEQITDALLTGAKQRLHELGVAAAEITELHVPGAIELPIVAQRLAASARYQAIIMLGAVIRGETSHYDYVCQQVSYGCQRVALDHSVPVIFGVLTTETKEQALQRVGGRHGHKGCDAADSAIAMIQLLETLE